MCILYACAGCLSVCVCVLWCRAVMLLLSVADHTSICAAVLVTAPPRAWGTGAAVHISLSLVLSPAVFLFLTLSFSSYLSLFFLFFSLYPSISLLSSSLPFSLLSFLCVSIFLPPLFHSVFLPPLYLSPSPLSLCLTVCYLSSVSLSLSLPASAPPPFLHLSSFW